MSNIYYWEKLTFSKLVGKVNFSERKIAEMQQLWRANRYKVYSGKRLFLHYCIQLFFFYKIVSQISFNLFCSGDKSLSSELLRKRGWFQGQNERFSRYLGWKLKFQKTETQFCRWKSTDNNDINIFLLLESSCTFFACDRKDLKILIANCCKIVQKNKLTHPKHQ